MSDIATALEGLLDANLEEIELTHAHTELIKQCDAEMAEVEGALQDEFLDKLKALRDQRRAVFKRLLAEQEARVLRLNGQEPPPADIVRFPRSQQMTARAE